MKKLLYVVAAFAIGFSVTRCGGASSGSGGSTTTFALSGTLDLSNAYVGISNLEPVQSRSLANSISPFAPTQCGDGYYYQVYCVAFSEPPVSATGNVSCSGNTGGFTVSGLPKNTGIGCFIRRNTTDTGTFSTLGTLEIPAATMTGTTTSLVGSGDIKMDVSIDTSGTISAVVANDSPTRPSNTTTTPTTTIDDLAFSGIYQISCATSTGSSEFNPAICKCQMGDWSASYMSKDACIADNASLISVNDTTQFVDLGLYKGTVTSNISITDGAGNPQQISAGTTLYGIGVWAASNGTTSLRTGGEGFPNTGMGANISFASAIRDPKVAVGWTNSGSISSADTSGVTVNLTGHSAQVATAVAGGTVGHWKTYAQWLYTQSSGFTCSWGAGNPSTDANCMSEFLNKIRRGYENGSNLVMPKVMMQTNCGMSGCDNVLANARVFVEGVDFEYNQSTWSGSQNAVTVRADSFGPRPSARHAFEQFEPTPGGGGSFTQREFDGRHYPCQTSGAEVNSALCDQTHNWLECQTRQEMAIRFMPTSTTGTWKIVFEQRSAQ